MTDYDTIVLDEGEKRVYELDEGETFENVLIDQRADDCSFSIRSHGGDYVIRNVGWIGGGVRDRHSYHIFASTDGNALIENVYMNNKVGEAGSRGGIWTGRDHSGHLTIRNTYIEGMGDNAAYCSSSGRESGGRGTVDFKYCYHRDNTVSQFRLGVTGSEVRNCVAVVNDPDGERGPYRPDRDSYGARCVWGRDGGELEVRHSSFHLDPEDYRPNTVFACSTYDDSYRDTELVVVDCDVNEDNPSLTYERNSDSTVNIDGLGYDPSVEVLADGGGVPTTAEMAARGEREMPDVPEFDGDGGNGGVDDPHDPDGDSWAEGDKHGIAFIAEPDAGGLDYVLDGTGSAKWTAIDYEPFGNSVEGGTYSGVDTITSDDGEWSASGSTGNGHGDALIVDGSVEHVNADSGLYIMLDGEVVTAEQLIEKTADDGGDNGGDQIMDDFKDRLDSVSDELDKLAGLLEEASIDIDEVVDDLEDVDVDMDLDEAVEMVNDSLDGFKLVEDE